MRRLISPRAFLRGQGPRCLQTLASATSRCAQLQASGRAGLVPARAELQEIHAQVSKLEPKALLEGANLSDLCMLCRVLSSALMPLQAQLLEEVGQKAVQTGTPDAAANFALAACEAGHSELGGQVVEAMRSAVGSDSALSGGGAASLALAAAAAKVLDATLLEALVRRCSAREMELSATHLGDLRLCAVLAGRSVLDKADSQVLSFLSTMCKNVLLDDPRGEPPSNYWDFLTDAENDLSQVLETCELPHSRGMLLGGAFFPLSSQALKAVISLETSGAAAIYLRGASGRSVWQSWKYRVAASNGWRVCDSDSLASSREVVSRQAGGPFKNQVVDRLCQQKHSWHLKSTSYDSTHAALSVEGVFSEQPNLAIV
ncbi:unnamed protein product [Effrenium voratum]|nr:unnamed protein product [Effrenium voratum]